jgi:hypothetical protein
MVAIAQRESGCGRTLHAYRASTHDDSYGPFMVNWWGSLAGVYEAAGFTRSSAATIEGGTAMAAWAYHRFGLCPWNKSGGYCR